jgi:hypothetical protein
VFGVSYEMLEDIKLITFEPEISHLHLLMCLTYFRALLKTGDLRELAQLARFF